MFIDVMSSRKCTVCEQEFKPGDDTGMQWIGLPDEPEPQGEAHVACIAESEETQQRLEREAAAFLKKTWEDGGRLETEETDFISVFQNVANNMDLARRHPSRLEVRVLSGCDGSNIHHFAVRPFEPEIQNAEGGQQ